MTSSVSARASGVAYSLGSEPKVPDFLGWTVVVWLAAAADQRWVALVGLTLVVGLLSSAAQLFTRLSARLSGLLALAIGVSASVMGLALTAARVIKLGVDPIWLGVAVGVNLQTSFLTPPFGFSLFYLRGVAPSRVTTGMIYKGVVPFVILQVVGLGLLFFFPDLATWLPKLIY